MNKQADIHIFCDEAGFTGNKLRDSQQVVFSYASVGIDPEEAKQLVQRIRTDYRIQAKELKESILLKQDKGRRAVADILKRTQGRFRVVAHLKPFALTSKLFEYIFEPAMSNSNSFLYATNFHRFVATLLFLHLRVQNKPAETLIDDFTRFAHKGDVSALEAIFPPSGTGLYTESPLHAIGLFAQLHKETIAEEVLRFREPGVPNWILDLTTTSLFHLLAWWGEQYDGLEVTCDESKPLKGDKSIFDTMVGRTDKVYINFQGEDHPYTFNLKAPLQLARSEDHPGIQIADIIAATTAQLFSNKYRGIDKPEDKEFAHLIQAHLHSSIWPDLGDADIAKPQCFANTVVLHELIDRSLSGEDLFEGLHQIAVLAYRSYAYFMRENPSLMPTRRTKKIHS